MVNCPDGSVCNVSVVPVEPGAPCYEYKDCSTFPCYTENCTLSPVLDVDVCIQSQCWTPIQPIPPNPTSHTNAIIICVAAFVCITIMILVTLRNKVKVLFGNIVEHFSRNSLNASAADLVDELLPPIYNPPTQAGILPPEGYSAPLECYSVLNEDESNSEESIAQTIVRQENEPPLAWDDRMN